MEKYGQIEKTKKKKKKKNTSSIACDRHSSISSLLISLDGNETLTDILLCC